jgi:GntR family transcriptional regulator, arabinose operon transcriptional repressor
MKKPAQRSKYSAIADLLRNNIMNEKFQEGSLIPTEKDIAEQNRVSLITVKKAISVLIDEGYLERIPGKKGTFVTENKQNKDKPNLIGIAIDDVSQNFGSQILRGIEDTLEEAGYYSIICSSDRNFEKVQKYFTSLLKNDVSGIIFAPVIGEKYKNQNLKILDPVIGNNIPYVLIDRNIPELSSNFVMSDHRRSGQLITEELISKGHMKTLIIYSDNCASMVDRFSGVKDIYLKHGLSIDKKKTILVDDNKWPFTKGSKEYEMIKAQIEEAGDFTAVYGLNNRLLDIAYQIVEENREKYGEHITYAVNDESHSIPPEKMRNILHTRQPCIELGRKAAELLLEKILTPQSYKSQIVFEDELINP